MTEVQMSITRALSELKLLNKRIEKITNGTTFISTRENGKRWFDHSETSKSQWQSVNDLISRYNKIKFAILKSNHETQIQIGSKTYSVIEAIAMKENIKYKKELLRILKEQKLNVDTEVSRFDSKLQQKLDNIINTSFGGTKETGDTDITAITEAYKKNNFIEVIDPLKIDKQILDLELEIDEFEKNIDFSLSESNARTHIVV